MLGSGKRTIKVILIGDPGSGKTSILVRFLGRGDIKDVKKTKGIAIESLHEGNIEYVFWDFSGQVHFRDIIIPFFAGANLAIAVFDLADPRSLNSLIREWKRYVLEQAKNVPVIVVGNKRDIKKITDESIREALEELKKSLNVVYYIETSAKTGENIEQLLRKIKDIGYRIASSGEAE